MAYEPTEWKSGDVISSQKLNKIEQGISNSVLRVDFDIDAGALNKTWKEIHDASSCVIHWDAGEYNDTKFISEMHVVDVFSREDAHYFIDALSVNPNLSSSTVGISLAVFRFHATSQDGYPQFYSMPVGS